MVGTIRETVSSVKRNNRNLRPFGEQENQATSVYSYYNDPDLLIREYFLSSSEQRSLIRKNVAQNINSLRSFLEVLKWGVNGKARDAHDGAVDLLAEISNINFLVDACNYLEATSLLWINDANKLFLLDCLWEILIQSIAYSYDILVEERFKLLQELQFKVSSNRRIFKASLIDAIASLSDDFDNEIIRSKIANFTFSEKDEYIRNYAKEVLQELA